LQHIYEAENGLEAVELVKKHHEDNNDFNFIITDNQMPVMDGITSVKLIREIGYKKTIIMITGNSIGEERAAMLENGIDHVLLKPIQKDEMFKILKL
jgi:CheY-like chemotaxis protein